MMRGSLGSLSTMNSLPLSGTTSASSVLVYARRIWSYGSAATSFAIVQTAADGPADVINLINRIFKSIRKRPSRPT
jgi:hypothetical protein